MTSHPEHTTSIHLPSGRIQHADQAYAIHNIYSNMIYHFYIYCYWLHCIQHLSPQHYIYCLYIIYHIHLHCCICLLYTSLASNVMYQGINMPNLHIITICNCTYMLLITLVLYCCTCVKNKRLDVMLYISL